MSMSEGLANEPAVDEGPWVTSFGDDPHSWNIEEGDETGLPGRRLVTDALRCLADCWGGYDPATAARVFNLPLALIDDIQVTWPIESDPGGVVLSDLSSLVQVLTGCRTSFGTASVADVARLTNQHPTRIVEAIGAAPWMFLSGDRDDFARLFIEHEGE